MAELVTARDDKGNTFQMTAEDAKRAGYTVPEASGEEDADVGKKAQQAAPNKAMTSPDNTKGGGK